MLKEQEIIFISTSMYIILATYYTIKPLPVPSLLSIDDGLDLNKMNE